MASVLVKELDEGDVASFDVATSGSGGMRCSEPSKIGVIIACIRYLNTQKNYTIAYILPPSAAKSIHGVAFRL